MLLRGAARAYDGVPVTVTDVFPDAPFTRAHAASKGITHHALEEALVNRTIRRLLRGVYVSTAVPDAPLLRAQAAKLVISKHAVVCDRTAAWIHGCETFDYRELDVLPPIECYVLRGHDPTDRPECAGGTRDLKPGDWMVIEGVRVTTPVRTAMDLGCKLSRRPAIAVMDALQRRHRFTITDMYDLLPRYRRRRGVRQLRSLVPLVDGRPESMAESWVKVEIADRELPMPEPQYWVYVDGVPTYRLDFAYPHAKVAIEYDGEEFHSSPADREADRVRREWLRAHGWTVIVLTKKDFAPQATDAWIRELRVALGMR